jgi:hypothetical protein
MTAEPQWLIHKYRLLTGATAPHHEYLFSYGGYSNDLDGFNSPWAIVKGRSNDNLTTSGSYNNDMIYVADRGNERIVQLREQAGGVGLEWIRSAQPINPALDPNYVSIEVDCWGNVYVVDMKNSQIVKLTSDLEYLTSYGTKGTGTKMGEFMYPKDFQVFFYWDQNLYEDDPRGKWIGTRKAVVLESWGDETGDHPPVLDPGLKLSRLDPSAGVA